MWFRLEANCGSHVGLDGKVYNSGDEIETDLDLVALFGKKFELLEHRKGSKAKVKAKPDIPEPDRVRGKKKASDSEEQVDDIEDEEDDSTVIDWDSEEYTDITDTFEDAEEAEVRVYRKGRNKFYVVDPTDGECYHEGESLNKKSAVKECIAGMFTEE